MNRKPQGMPPFCDKNGVKKGPWTLEEDQKLTDYIDKHGHGTWRSLPKLAGLNRCGKSCRLRWTNYLRPNIKRGKFSPEEEQAILQIHFVLGNKWSAIAKHLPGRTDNEIKNFFNTRLKKKMIQMGFDPMTHRPRADFFANLGQLIQADALQAAKLEYLRCLLQSATTIATSPSSSTIPTELEQNGLPSPWHISPLSTARILDGISGQGLVTMQLPEPSSLFIQQPIINGTILNPDHTTNAAEGELNFLPPLADFSTSNLGDACRTSCCDAEGNSADQLPIWSDSFYDQLMSEFA